MSLLYAHPFSRMATADLTLGTNPAFSTISNLVIETSTVPPGTGYGLNFSSGAGYGYRSGLGNNTGLCLGFDFRTNTLTAVNGHAFAVFSNNSPVFGGGGGIHCSLCMNGDGSLQIYRGRPITFTDPAGQGTSLGSPSTSVNASYVIAAGQFYYIEFVVPVFSNTVGTAQVWVNGVKWLDLSGLDNVDGGTTTANTFALGGVGNTTTYVGNVYVTSPSGGNRTGRLGPQKFTTYSADVDGANADFALSTGSDGSNLVDDTAPNGDTDYIESTGAGDKSTFTLPTVTAAGQILGVQLRANVKKTDGAALTARTVLRIAGVDYLGTSQAPLTSYGYQGQIYEISPDTTADFTTTELSGAEIGVEHES